VEGNGKEVEVPTLKVALKWKGRLQVVTEAGLPSHAPGRMFRKEFTGIPLPFAEEVPTNATNSRRP
jgi:hypothetical protein